MPDDANITTQGSCDHMIKEPALQTLDEDVMRTKELVSGSTSQETSKHQELSSHILHKVSGLEKKVESDLGGPADMEVDEDSNTAKSVNTDKADREEPSTSQQTRAERKRKLPTDVGKISNTEGYTSAKR